MHMQTLPVGFTFLLSFGFVACFGGSPFFGASTSNSSLQSPQDNDNRFFSVALDDLSGKVIVSSTGHEAKNLWVSPKAGPMVIFSRMDFKMDEKKSGHYKENKQLLYECYDKNRSFEDKGNQGFVVSGELTGHVDCDGSHYRLSFLEEKVSAKRNITHLKFKLSSDNNKLNYVKLRYQSQESEAFYGFGVQPTHMNLKGHYVPILVQEQGIGRGFDNGVMSVVMKALHLEGNALTSYIAAPYYMTSELNSLFLENQEYSAFDLREDDVAAVEVNSDNIVGRILYGSDPLQIIEAYTEYTGRMKKLPAWINEGAILGIQGGSQKVRNLVQYFLSKDTPIAAVWLQDWVGTRKTIVGSQLWWNWFVDKTLYPDWQRMLGDFKKIGKQENGGVRIMGYVNPMLVDTSAREDGASTQAENLFMESEVNNRFVKNHEGEIYPIANSNFDAGLLDLSNPETREQVRKFLGRMQRLGMSGWMADYAEALPFDSKLFDGDPKVWHNHYPEAWAGLNREVAEGSDMVFFSRSGYTKSPGLATLFWLGDQTVTWDKYDGLHSAVIGLMSGGFSGFSLNHSDIGGFATAGEFKIARGAELFIRWMEFEAFTAVFRSHEGNQPESNVQLGQGDIFEFEKAGVTEKVKVDEAFTRFAKVYAGLAPYREMLYEEAAELGLPVARHPFLHAPEVEVFKNMDDQFMLGEDVMVAPVLLPGLQKRQLTLGPGLWVHLWSGVCYEVKENNHLTIEVAAPVLEPPVFIKSEALHKAILKIDLKKSIPKAACQLP